MMKFKNKNEKQMFQLYTICLSLNSAYVKFDLLWDLFDFTIVFYKCIKRDKTINVYFYN